MKSIIIAILFVALGITLHALHTYIVRESSKRAYANGYNQAKKEEQIRKDASSGVRYPWRTYPIVNTTTTADKKETKGAKPLINEEFMEELKANGRAAAKIQ